MPGRAHTVHAPPRHRAGTAVAPIMTRGTRSNLVYTNPRQAGNREGAVMARALPRPSEGDHDVELKIGGVRVSLDFSDGPLALGDRPMPGSFSPAYFSHLELQILEVLGEHGPLPRQAIADRLGTSLEGRLKALIANLGERRAIRDTEDGFVVACDKGDVAGVLAAVKAEVGKG